MSELYMDSDISKASKDTVVSTNPALHPSVFQFIFIECLQSVIKKGPSKRGKMERFKKIQ